MTPQHSAILEYRTPEPRPPARTGLMVIGALVLVVAGILLLGAAATVMAGVLMARAIALAPAPVTTMPATAPAAVVVGGGGGGPVTTTVRFTGGPATPVRIAPSGFLAIAAAGYALVAGLLGWLGVAIIRCRRWVRPVMLAVTGFVIVSIVGAAPLSVMTMLSSDTPMPWGSGVTLLFYVMMFGTYLVVPAVLFWFFARRSVVEALAFYDTRGSWTERWPVAVFGVGAAGVYGTLMCLVSLVAAIWLQAGLPVTAAFGAGVVAHGGLAAACAFARARTAWAVAMGVVVAYGLVTMVMHVVWPGHASELGRAYTRSMIGSDLPIPVGPTGVSLALGSAFCFLVYAAALIALRRQFVDKRTGEDVPLAVLA